jgi:ferritin-like metal-binding protein YciE
MKKVIDSLTGGLRELPTEPFGALLSNALYTERTLIDTLPQLIEEAQDPELRTSLEEHLEETRQHAANVERIFEAFGAEPVAERSALMVALKETHGELRSKAPTGTRDLVVAIAAATTEHVEIAMYSALRQIAEAIGTPDVAGLIDENLAQEQHALEQAEKAMAQLASQRRFDLAE